MLPVLDALVGGPASPASQWREDGSGGRPLRIRPIARLSIVIDEPVSVRMSEAIRQRAGYGSPAEQPQDPSVEPVQRDVDFGAGAGQRALPLEPDMSSLMRASYFGGWHRSGGGR